MSGYLWIHSAPAAFCPHIEWAIAGVLGVPAHFDWRPQPAGRSSYRSEIRWTGSSATASSMASALLGWPQIRFEIAHEPVDGDEGIRYAYTPRLGVFQSAMSATGDLLIHEERLRSALAQGLSHVQQLLGTDWDEELDVFRHASADHPVRWLAG